jgi:hypothetical protein
MGWFDGEGKENPQAQHERITTMSQPLTALLDLASVGSALTCTLSPESVQVIFYALSFLDNQRAWQEDFFDEVTDTEQDQIDVLLANIATEMLP